MSNKLHGDFGFLDIVRVKRPLRREGRDLSTDMEGVVIEEYSNGKGYEVDFEFSPAIFDGDKCLDRGDYQSITLNAEDLELIKMGKGDRLFPWIGGD